jgi:hypothetical protein
MNSRHDSLSGMGSFRRLLVFGLRPWPYFQQHVCLIGKREVENKSILHKTNDTRYSEFHALIPSACCDQPSILSSLADPDVISFNFDQDTRVILGSVDFLDTYLCIGTMTTLQV